MVTSFVISMPNRRESPDRGRRAWRGFHWYGGLGLLAILSPNIQNRDGVRKLLQHVSGTIHDHEAVVLLVFGEDVALSPDYTNLYQEMTERAWILDQLLVICWQHSKGPRGSAISYGVRHEYERVSIPVSNTRHLANLAQNGNDFAELN